MGAAATYCNNTSLSQPSPTSLSSSASVSQSLILDGRQGVIIRAARGDRMDIQSGWTASLVGPSQPTCLWDSLTMQLGTLVSVQR